MADAFHEADEQYRAARMRDLVSRGWPYAAAVVLALLLGALGYWAWQRHADAEAARTSRTYADGLAALQAGREADAQHSFEDVAGSGPPAYKALAMMQEAGLRLKANKPVQAQRLLDEAARTAPDRIIGDAAALEAAYIAMDTQPLAQVETRLAPLLDAKRPYRDMAREALATAKLADGQAGAARSDFALLAISPDVSDAARARAQSALGMIDAHSATTLGAAAKAELALPPLPAPPPGAAAIPGAQ